MTNKELEELHKDAERFRFLAKHTHVEDRDGGYTSHYRIMCLGRHAPAYGRQKAYYHKTLAEAVDAEMSK